MQIKSSILPNTVKWPFYYTSVFPIFKAIWTATRQKQWYDPCVHWRLRSAWASPPREPWILSYPLSAQQRLWSGWVDAQLIWVFAGCTSNFVGLVTVWLLFSFNTHKISFLRFQRHVQLFRMNREEVMIMKKQWQWRGEHNAKKIKRCDRHYFWVQQLLIFACSWHWNEHNFRAVYKWLLTKCGDLFCQRTISVFY